MNLSYKSMDLKSWLHRGVREVFRDETLWALDKAAGILSHPNPPAKSAPNAILRAPYDFERELYRLDIPGQRQIQAHLIHRLDQETSGLILCAFNGDAASELKAALFHREVKKEYRALLLGVPGPSRGTWADHLDKISEGRRVVVKAVRGTSRGRVNALAHYHVLERISPASLALVAIRPETGRTHQLRVQAACRDHPIAGDNRYGEFAANRFLSAEIGLKHMFLHALRIELRHPSTGHVLKLHAPLTKRLLLPLERARTLARPVPRRG
jgi:23S rRNA pseudouridine955/2504/2580 synthase